MPVNIGDQPDHGFNEPIRLMRDCHRRVEKFLGILQRIVADRAGGELNAEYREALGAALRYFKSAAPWHTRDEEDSLFPRMRELKDGRAVAVMERIASLESDHDEANVKHAAIDGLGNRWLEAGTLNEADLDRLRRLVDELQQTYQKHIADEDNVVFPLAEQLLPATSLTAIGREMAERRGLNPDMPERRCKHASRHRAGIDSPSTATNTNLNQRQPPQEQTMTTTLDTRTSVGAFVVDRPARSRVFEQLKIDYCCGGKLPLADACAKSGLDAQDVLARLLEVDSSAENAGLVEADRMSLTELADHIQQTHHAYLKEELPRLMAMVRKVAAVHGDRYPWMLRVLSTFGPFAEELTQHMMKEERVLFPLIRQIDAGQADPSQSHCGSVANPIRMMEHEHDNAGDALVMISELTSGYTAPADACNTFRATLDGLQQLEADMYQHVHKENNILFPRAIEREASLVSQHENAS